MNPLVQRLRQAGATKRLLVLGDIMLDRYTWGSAMRVSPEAPVVVLEADTDEVRLGGASAVAAMLSAWGPSVRLTGVVGDDGPGRTARRLLQEAGVEHDFVLTIEGRPTTQKERFVGRAANRHPHQMLRVDRETAAPIKDSVEERVIADLESQVGQCDAVLVSDYGKGVCTDRVLRAAIVSARDAGKPLIVDPAIASDFRRYAGATALKPNRREAELATGTVIGMPSDAFAPGRALRSQLSMDAVVITLDCDGLAYVSDDDERVYVTRQRSVHDVTGAGDTAFCMLGLGIAAGLDPTEQATLVNLAAGLQVERWGASPLSPDDLEEAAPVPAPPVPRQKIVSPAHARELAEQYRRQGMTIVLTNGCFDLLHYGHVQTLQQAAGFGDRLFVAVNSDLSVRELKGPERPVISEDRRSAMLAALQCVDHVLVFEESTPLTVLRSLRPDVLVKGGTTPEIVGREFVESYGGRVCQTSVAEGISTTKLLERAGSSAEGQG